MTIGPFVQPVVDGGWIRFLNSSKMDALPEGVLKHWLEHLDRKQRKYAADVNERAKDILNTYQHLNRWLTSFSIVPIRSSRRPAAGSAPGPSLGL